MINLIRIDDRLIHGQVMAVWVRVLSIDHIIVADDVTAADEFSLQIMRLAMPSTIQLSVSGIAVAVRLLQSAAVDKSHTLVLLKSVESAVRLYQLFPFRHLDVGGIGMTPGRQALWRSIAASTEEIESLRNLARVGVNVYLQMIPSDEKRRLPDT